MDPDMKAAETIATFLQWQHDHPVEAEAVGFEFVEATEASLTFTAKGRLFQLLLPTVLPDGDVEPNEIFIAMNLDNSAPNSLMIALNEKLERVPIGLCALEQGLGVFAKALVSFEGKRKRATTEPADMNSLPTLAQNWSKDDSDADLNTDMDDLDDDSNKGFLHGVTREASDRCYRARCRSVQSFLCTPVHSSFSGPSAISYMHDILQFCNVSTVSSLCQVRVQAEVTGFVNDVKMASSLGFLCSKTIQILMEFDEFFWGERGSQRPLTLKRVAVGLENSRSANFLTDSDTGLVEVMGIESDGEFEVECKKFPGRQKIVAYGTSVLLPELIQTFFRYRSGQREVSKLRSKPWGNRYVDQALEYFTAIENPFIGLICFLGYQLRSLPSWCAVCWSLLPASVWRLRTCQNDLCLYEFEELGLGAAIHHEIQESPEVVELELSLACAAASSARDVFEPFPSFFLQCHEVRGRSGWFSLPATTTKKTGVATGQSSDGVDATSKFRIKFKEMDNKELTHLMEVLQSIPSIANLQECADENALKKKLSKILFSAWTKKDAQKKSEQCKMWLAYDLMRFILSTNRLSLRIMKGEEALNLAIKPKFQFVVIHDSPEKEAIFEERRTQRGSFFAFHGSGIGNWYSILRNGLRPMSNTKFMSSGAAHGHGIYLSDSFSLSYQYAKGQTGSWKNGSLKEGMSVVAICEVVTPLPTSAPPSACMGYAGALRRSNNIYVVPPGQEDDVSVRYLLVLDNTVEVSGGNGMSINGSVLQDARLLVDLREKFERLKQEDQAQQQKTLLDRRMEAFMRMKRDVTDGLQIDKKLASSTEPRYSLSPESEAESSSPPPSKRADNHTLAVPMPSSKRLKEKNSADTRAPLTATATQAITKEFRNIQNEIRKARKGTTSSYSGPHTESFLADVTVDIPDETNLCVWNVNLSQNLFKSYALLYKDLERLAVANKQPESSVLLEITFSGMYPFEPPFIRVVRPRFLFHTGHVTVGGSICMELLTTTGWLPSFSFESVLVQIVNAFVQGEGRIDMKAIGRDYSKEAARSAFTRVAAQHGWTVHSSKH